ncbi:hypothetical protein HPB52_004612 [Rhipicephalus sanguineus]|uniref:Uncharacterized protein n=1 Tax=Rhipicephalus sanguineus TaxID=34632 RepID=A0A9D4PQL7_RHISA|nr:hypothetical protein HPB52_004612 [Rhipicephalus sanguineus]
MIAYTSSYLPPFLRCMSHPRSPRAECHPPGTSANAELKISLLKAVRFMYGAWYEVKQSTISNCFKKAGFLRQDENSPPADSATDTAEAADLAELWALVAGCDTGAVSMDEFLTADCAASSCEEVTDEAITGDVLSRQTTALSHNSSDCDNEAGSGTLAPTSMSTESALLSIDLLIDFTHSKGLPEVFAQQLESMHTAVVKLQLPRKQAKISDYLGAPKAWHSRWSLK